MKKLHFRALGICAIAALAIVSPLQAQTPPTISPVANQVLAEDTASPAIAFTVGDAETPVGSLTVAVASTNTTLIPVANVTMGGAGVDRTVTILPATNLFGESDITLTVTDGDGQTNTTTFHVTVTSVNDLPVIAAITNVVMNEDGDVTIPIFISDVETATNALTLTGTRTNTALFPTIGTASTSRLRLLGGGTANRSLQIRPAANLSGVSEVTLRVVDGNNGTNTQTFLITVNPVYDPPILANDTFYAAPNTTTTFRPLTNDVAGPEPGQVFWLLGFTQPTNGTLVFGTATNTVDYTPNAGYTGPDFFIYTNIDNTGVKASATVSIAVSHPPTISAISDVVMDEDGDVTINYTVGDTETPAASLTVTGTHTNTALFSSIGTSGTSRLQIGGSGASRTLRIRPNANATGQSLVTLTVRDASGGTASSSFLITVNPTDDPPVAVADTRFAYLGRPTSLNVLINDFSVDPGHPLSVASTTPGAHGITSVSPSNTVIYTPTNNFPAFDTFTYTITDDRGSNATATVTVYLGVIDIVHTDMYINFIGGEWYAQYKADFQAFPNGGTQIRPNSDEAVAFANPDSKLAWPDLGPEYDFAGATNGQDVWLLPQTQLPQMIWLGFSNEGSGPEMERPTRIELVSFAGPGHMAVFTSGVFGEPTVHIDTADGVNSINDAAVGGNETEKYEVQTHEHMNWTFTQPGRYTLALRPSALINTTNSAGEPVQITNVGPVAIYKIDVDSLQPLPLIENPPLARDDAFSVAENAFATTLHVLANDSSSPDPGEALSITAVTQPANGFVSIAGDAQSVLYTPAVNFEGTNQFTYTLTDERGGVAVATVTVTGVPYRFETARRYTDGHGDVRFRYQGGALWVGYNLTAQALVDGQYAGNDEEHHDTGVDFPITALKSIIPDMPFPRPEGSEWDFLGTAANELLWFIPEVQEPGKPWLGFSSEELNFGEWVGDVLNVQLTGFSAPAGAHFTMFDSGPVGEPHIHMATADGIDANDQYQYQSGGGPVPGFRVSTHAHVNWMFTKRGRYELTFKISGTNLVDGLKENTVVLVFDVAPPAAPAFTFEPFHLAGAASTLLSDIRNDGALVGRYIDGSGISQGFVQDGTNLTTFNVTGTTATFPGGLDNFGRVAGFYRDAANPEVQHGFIRQTNGTITTLDGPDQTFTYAWRINDAGQVNGYWFEDPFFITSFRRATNGTLTTNLFTGSPVGTVTRGMNEAGDTAGWKWDENFTLEGVVFAGGQTNVFTVAGWEHTLPGDINNLGDIAGTVNNGFTNTAGFFRRADGAVTVFNPPGAVEVEVFGLNDAGIVVGEYVDAGGNRHGFIAHPAAKLPSGHTDVGIAFEDGAFDLHIHDEETDTEYEPGGAVLCVLPAAEQYIPDTAALSFLGRPGYSTWILPAVEDENLLFLGFGAEEIESGVFVDDALRMELVSVEGAGDFFVFTLDQFGNPVVHINSADGISAADFMPLVAGGHQHVNWAFSAPGTYRIGFRARGTLVDGNQEVVSDIAYYTFTVPAAQLPQPVEPDDSLVYKVIDLGTFGGTAFANALGINNAGVVVGGANFPDNNTFHPYRFSGNGPKEDLGTAGGDIAGANDINEAGEITGTTFLVAGEHEPYLPFRYTTNGVMQVITNILGGLNGEAAAINEAGRIVGSADIAIGQFESVAFYADADNVMHSLGTFGGVESRAENINDAGYIVGNAQLTNGQRRAFRHLGNGPLNPATDDLGTLGGNRSQAHAINAAGKVTGTSRVAGNGSSPAFLWEEGVGMTNLGTLGSGTLAYGFAINSNDVVVGWSLTVSNDFDSIEAFIWDREHGMRNLNDLVPRGLGLRIDGAYGINDQGWIAGTAKRLSDGAATPVLLKPATRLKTGDTDIGIAYEDGEWDLHVHAEVIDQEFSPDAALLHAAATTYGTVPTNAAYAFLGAAGAPVWTLPAVEDPRQLFLGIAAEEIESGVFVSDEIKLTLTAVNGPGHFALYTVDGFGVPQVRMNTRDGIDASDAVIAIAGSHQHYNWGFSAPGVYRVRVKASGTLVAGSQFVESEEVEYCFEVIGIETRLTIARSGGNATISFVTQDGLTYQLESAPTVNGPWMNEGAAFLGTGRAKHITIPLSPGAQFFRVVAGN